MEETSNIHVEIDSDIKNTAEKILSQLGIPLSTAIDIFLRQVIITGGIPFDQELKHPFPSSMELLSDANL